MHRLALPSVVELDSLQRIKMFPLDSNTSFSTVRRGHPPFFEFLIYVLN